MFRNYVTAALRNLVRDKLYAAINITGLAVGIAGAVLAALFIRDEMTYDTWLPGYEQVYQVTSTLAGFRSTTPQERADTYRNVADSLKLDYPEVIAAVRLNPKLQTAIRRNDVSGLEPLVTWADPDFFTVFPIPFIAGDPRTALSLPDGIVLTKHLARKYFGNDAPIGEPLEIDGKFVMRVTGVIDDWPSNTNFIASAFASSLSPESYQSGYGKMQYSLSSEPYTLLNSPTFFRLKPGASIDVVRRDIPSFVQRRLPIDILGETKLRYRPLSSIHLEPPFRYDITKPTGSHGTLYAVGAIGVLVLTIAVFNFINMVTARAARRAVEVGVRKVAGASRHQVMGQFLCEALFYAAVAMILGVALVHTTMPWFTAFLGRDIIFNLWLFPGLGLGIVALALATGVLAGAYPAFVLSRFRPAAVMKSGLMKRRGEAVTVRRMLVTAQFAILIALMLSTAVIYRQTTWAMNGSLRFDKDQVITITRGCTEPIKTAILALNGVKGAACSWNPLGGDYRASAITPDGREIHDIHFSPIDFGFFEVYGVKPLAGRMFSEDYGADSVAPNGSANPNVILNETAMRMFGFSLPETAIGQTVSWRRLSVSRQAVDTMPLLSSHVVGVVPDFSLDVAAAVSPQVYYVDLAMSLPITTPFRLNGQTLSVKLTGANVPETLEAIDRIWYGQRDPDDPRPMVRTFIDQQLETVYQDITRQMQLFAVFSVLALFIGILGLFGLSAFTAEQRTKEIGIRKAMGAKTADILVLLIWQFMKPVLWANAVAWPVAYVATRRWLEGFAYHVALDPWIFLAASSIALVIAMLTVGGHAWLVARTQPVHALRYE